jgi:hypothetical protein
MLKSGLRRVGNRVDFLSFDLPRPVKGEEDLDPGTVINNSLWDMVS